jgi:hypothetical protein
MSRQTKTPGASSSRRQARTTIGCTANGRITRRGAGAEVSGGTIHPALIILVRIRTSVIIVVIVIVISLRSGVGLYPICIDFAVGAGITF